MKKSQCADAGAERIFDYFKEISAIPRPSGHEKKIADYLEAQGNRLKLDVFRDEQNNVILKKHGSVPGDLPVVLQSHMDMVWETADPKEEIEQLPKEIHEEDGFIRTCGTTLGADNGIGMALMLALLENNGDYPPLEAVFTSNEEETMEGAMALSAETINGTRLINLDSEQEGVFTVGAAGGISAFLEFPVIKGIGAKEKTAVITVSGGRGGHSGLEISQKRENAIQLLVRFLRRLDGGLWELSFIEGGSRSNAIPSEAEAWIRTDSTARIKEAAAAFMKQCRDEWDGEEGLLSLTVGMGKEEKCGTVYETECRERLLLLLENLPHGVRCRTKEIIFSSVNLATVRTVGQSRERVQIELSLRSSFESWYRDEVNRICRLGQFMGAKAEWKDEYPAWAYKKNSEITGILSETYKSIFGHDPLLENVHAGVECGIIMKNCPSVKDGISIGPTIIHAHTVNEAVELDSVRKVYRLLDAALIKMNGQGREK